MPDLPTPIRHQGDVAVFAFPADGPGDDLATLIATVVKQGTRKLVFDVTAVLFLSSPILGRLIGGKHVADQAGAQACICCPTANNREVFSVTHLSVYLRVFASLDEAVNSF